jgi:alpha-N-arabinofuranosidase
MGSRLRFLPALLLILTTLPGYGQHARLLVDATDPIATVGPTLYGLMTEEINHSYDGGLYAELIANRTFHHEWDGYEQWTLVAHGGANLEISESSTGPSQALPHGLKLTIHNVGGDFDAGIANNGYWGIALQPHTTYTGSFYGSSDGIDAARIQLVSNTTGAIIAASTVPLQGLDWKHYPFSLKIPAGIPAAPAQSRCNWFHCFPQLSISA